MNFGGLIIDEENVIVQIRNKDGDVVILKTIPISSLEHKTSEISQLCDRHKDSWWFKRYTIDIPHKLIKFM